jgi:hypothetical protein
MTSLILILDPNPDRHKRITESIQFQLGNPNDGNVFWLDNFMKTVKLLTSHEGINTEKKNMQIMKLLGTDTKKCLKITYDKPVVQPTEY